MSTRLLATALGLLLSLGCATDEAPQDMAPDLSMPDMAPYFSCCGKPGDKGNNLQVGMFCAKVADCFDNDKATLCSSLGDDKTHFCTFRCTKNGPADQCGTDASCTCDSGGGNCGCVPNLCLNPPTPIPGC